MARPLLLVTGMARGLGAEIARPKMFRHWSSRPAAHTHTWLAT
jgi:hypothetical protein